MSERKPESARVLLARNLSYLRKKTGIGRPRIAELAGLSVDQVRHMEKGTRGHSEESLESLARALKCHPSQLIGPELPPVPVFEKPAFSLVRHVKDVPPSIAERADKIEKLVVELNAAYLKAVSR